MLTSMPRDYSLIAPVYDQVFNKVLSEGHRKLGQILKNKKTAPGYRVLEVGVGSGLTFDYLPNGIEYHGIDVNNKMLALAQGKARSLRRKRITLSLMDAHKLKFKANSFDMVMAASVLSAVDNPEKVMQEMIKVTKKGGSIAVITNMRENTYKSKIIKAFDPFTKSFLGFRTDLDLEFLKSFSELELIESKQVNNLLGFPLSTFLLFKKR